MGIQPDQYSVNHIMLDDWVWDGIFSSCLIYNLTLWASYEGDKIGF